MHTICCFFAVSTHVSKVGVGVSLQIFSVSLRFYSETNKKKNNSSNGNIRFTIHWIWYAQCAHNSTQLDSFCSPTMKYFWCELVIVQRGEKMKEEKRKHNWLRTEFGMCQRYCIFFLQDSSFFFFFLVFWFWVLYFVVHTSHNGAASIIFWLYLWHFH